MKVTTTVWLALTAMTAMAGCGGGGSSKQANGIAVANGPNVATLIVDGGPQGIINAPFVSVTVCEPGTSNCVTVDHVLVDTASVGLRLMGSLLSALNLPVSRDGNSNALYECVQFADSHTWGSLKTADIKIASEQASNLTLNIIDDSLPPAVAIPADCSNGLPAANSVVSFGANGVIGLQPFKEDCPACTTQIIPGTYYTCSGASCQGTMLTPAQLVQNPVYHFATDNNGVILQLPAVSSAGAFGVRGTLIFGIDTQANNQLGTARVLSLNPLSGNFATTYKGQVLNQSFIDSGSNGYFFNDAALANCTSSGAAGFYCPGSAQTLSATQTSNTGVASAVNFNVANAEALTSNQPTYTAFSNLAGTNPLSSSFDWGLPFFYGRNVYVAIEGRSTSAGAGPYFAY
jgi:Protein of unknown function (DUF3443)